MWDSARSGRAAGGDAGNLGKVGGGLDVDVAVHSEQAAQPLRLVVAVLQQQLRGVGIVLDIRAFDPATFMADVVSGAYQMYSLRWIGGNEDPRHRGERRELRDKVTVPDVLIQAHSASLQMMFYTGEQFPVELKGSAFAAEHGSWNRATRTGYKIIRAIVKDGVPTGE